MNEISEAMCTIWDNGHLSLISDDLVREEPLEIRVNGAPVAVLMRTPGCDDDLVRGFLLTENIVQRSDDVHSVRPCAEAETEHGESHIMRVVLASHVVFDLARFRRNLYASSSCGLCGRASIEAVMSLADPVDSAVTISLEMVPKLVEAMRRSQPVFDSTGALHAAAAFSHSGESMVVREDIGRHNAVDKVVGYHTAREQPIDILVVSGRVSFEIIQKALIARIPVVVGVSAASALAVELARKCGVGLVGFARGSRMVIYSKHNMQMEKIHE